MIDVLIVGSGLYGCVMAHELAKRGKHCLVLERPRRWQRVLRGA